MKLQWHNRTLVLLVAKYAFGQLSGKDEIMHYFLMTPFIAQSVYYRTIITAYLVTLKPYTIQYMSCTAISQ
jgi:predicted membrane protein